MDTTTPPQPFKSRPTSFEFAGLSAEARSSLISTLLGCALLIRGGLFLLNPQLATLDCHRTSARDGMCQLTTASLVGQQTTPIPVNSLQGAAVQKSSTVHQIRLLTTLATIDLPPNHTFESVGEKVDRVNAFVQDETISAVTVRQDNRWLSYPTGILFALLGGALLYVEAASLLKQRRSS